jgi:hypothetical protein
MVERRSAGREGAATFLPTCERLLSSEIGTMRSEILPLTTLRFVAALRVFIFFIESSGAPKGEGDGRYRDGQFTCEALESRAALREMIREVRAFTARL